VKTVVELRSREGTGGLSVRKLGENGFGRARETEKKETFLKSLTTSCLRKKILSAARCNRSKKRAALEKGFLLFWEKLALGAGIETARAGDQYGKNASETPDGENLPELTLERKGRPGVTI